MDNSKLKEEFPPGNSKPKAEGSQDNSKPKEEGPQGNSKLKLEGPHSNSKPKEEGPQGNTKPKEECSQVVIAYEFVCTKCGLSETAHYKGRNPPFSRKIELKYPSYVMKDPFSPQGKGEILILGADCAICEKAVCVDKQCSIFYLKNYCLECVNKSIGKFPQEITNKIKMKSC